MSQQIFKLLRWIKNSDSDPLIYDKVKKWPFSPDLLVKEDNLEMLLGSLYSQSPDTAKKRGRYLLETECREAWETNWNCVGWNLAMDGLFYFSSWLKLDCVKSCLLGLIVVEEEVSWLVDEEWADWWGDVRCCWMGCCPFPIRWKWLQGFLWRISKL